MKKEELEKHALFRIWQVIFYGTVIIVMGFTFILGIALIGNSDAWVTWLALPLEAVVFVTIWKAVIYIIVGKIKQND